ncbi:hypothetical protein [Bosea sp. BK604]|uniref:hypothetical protein n=1 Tax=Bosea sp. BK604 TaxID=2512180 RepID=UPI001044E8D9|nr:hypothetical protein [Bosea sp. BK604]
MEGTLTADNDHNAPPVPMLPGTAVVHMSDLDRLATTAAKSAARMVQEQSVKREEIEEIAETAAKAAIDGLLEQVFDVAPGDKKALIEVRRDFTAMRSARETREAVVRHGMFAIVGLFMTGIGTAIWFTIKGGK